MNRKWRLAAAFLLIMFCNCRAATSETDGTLEKMQTAGNESAAANEETKSMSDNPLAETSWRLVDFQSMDDAIGSPNRQHWVYYCPTPEDCSSCDPRPFASRMAEGRSS